MKKTLKIISVLLITIMLVMAISTVCEASKVEPKDINPTYEADVSQIKTTAGKILGLIRNVAIIGGVILIAVLGVKYMLGSVEEKAEYKKSFMPLIIGAVVVMAASQIATMIFTLV